MQLVHKRQLAKGDDRPAIFIRYNPDTFYKDGVKQLVSGTDTAQAERVKQEREKELVACLKQDLFGAKRSLRVLYMYYDCYMDDNKKWQLSICNDPAYCLDHGVASVQ